MKFYRKMQLGLLMKNKFTKYLFFAIEEIALLFIGMLMVSGFKEIKKS